MRWRSLWKAWRQKRIGIPSTRPHQVPSFFLCMFRVLFVALSEMLLCCCCCFFLSWALLLRYFRYEDSHSFSLFFLFAVSPLFSFLFSLFSFFFLLKLCSSVAFLLVYNYTSSSSPTSSSPFSSFPPSSYSSSSSSALLCFHLLSSSALLCFYLLSSPALFSLSPQTLLFCRFLACI